MNHNPFIKFHFLAILICVSCSTAEKPPLRSQNSSPMTESIRTHDRVPSELCLGQRKSWEFEGKTVQLFIPESRDTLLATRLVIHFHGLPEVTEHAVCGDTSTILLNVNAGSGSSVYQALFERSEAFAELLEVIREQSGIKEFKSTTLSAWSAGYGAIRALLSTQADLIDNVLLLDGLHTSYIPERVVLSEGGKLDSTQLQSFLHFGRQAMTGKKKFIITHSSIFPGTFSSTTECTEYLIQQLGLERSPILIEGPVGMQQVGKASGGQFSVLSYAGNTAPDHIDHLHGYRYFLEQLDKL